MGPIEHSNNPGWMHSMAPTSALREVQTGWDPARPTNGREPEGLVEPIGPLDTGHITRGGRPPDGRPPIHTAPPEPNDDNVISGA